MSIAIELSPFILVENDVRNACYFGFKVFADILPSGDEGDVAEGNSEGFADWVGVDDAQVQSYLLEMAMLEVLLLAFVVLRFAELLLELIFIGAIRAGTLVF